jgi:hypothetical protein
MLSIDNSLQEETIEAVSNIFPQLSFVFSRTNER